MYLDFAIITSTGYGCQTVGAPEYCLTVDREGHGRQEYRNNSNKRYEEYGRESRERGSG